MGKVKVRVPATSANLGAGFDSWAALTLYNYIEAEETETACKLRLRGEREFPPHGREKPGLQVNEIPVRQGRSTPDGLKLNQPYPRNPRAWLQLGLHRRRPDVRQRAVGQPFSQRELMGMAAKLEGHSDNSTAAVAAGFTISVFEKDEIFYYSHPVNDDLKFVLLIPDYAVTTQKARNTLPGHYPRRDVSFNISHASLPVASFLSGNYENLLCAVDDRIHEPYRKVFIDGYQKIHNKKATGLWAPTSAAPGQRWFRSLRPTTRRLYYEA